MDDDEIQKLYSDIIFSLTSHILILCLIGNYIVS